jgi:hypothetical protein
MTSQHEQTRVWWAGDEVRFIRWTDQGLVFHWGDPRETAVHMPRGAVMRLMQKGVLQIEGRMPGWTNPAYRPPEEPPQTGLVTPNFSRIQRAPEPPKPEPSSSRRSIVSRLIRKLGGDPARASG